MEHDSIKLKNIKPELSGYVRKAQDLLNKQPFPDEKSVHDVRILMKKARAVLRLIAPQMRPEFITREIKALREVGRMMNCWRETFVNRKTLKSIKKIHPDLFVQLADNEKINAILKKPSYLLEPDDGLNEKLQQIKDIIKDSGYRIRFEPMDSLKPDLLLKELEVTYNTTVNCYLLCRNYPKQSNIHELRKRSKDLLYQLWFFRPLNVSGIKTFEKRLSTLTGNLGDYNDHVQLMKAIGYRYEYTANAPILDEFAIIVLWIQDRYLAKAWPIAYKMFCPGQKLVNILGFKLLVI